MLSNKYGNSWNYAAIAIFDLFMLVVILVSILFGWYGQDAIDDEGDDEKNSAEGGGY